MGGPRPTVSRRMSWSIPLLVGGIFGGLSTLARVGDSDLFWHLAAGRQTLADGLQRLDRFSWTANGTTVLTDQWLGQVVWYSAYAGGEWRGVILLRALLVAAIVTLIVAATLWSARRPWIAVLAAFPAILLTRFAWTERPELMGLACFAALLLILRIARERPRVLLTVPALLLLWANLHASFALGVAVVLIVCGEMALHRGAARGIAIGVIFASLIATILTPSGTSIWTSNGGHFLAPPRGIQEEGVPDVTEPYGLVFALALAAVMATAMLSRRALPRDVALLLPVLFVSLTAARHTPFFAVASAPYLAEHGPEAIAALARRFRVHLPRVSAPSAIPPARADIATAVIALATVLVASFAAPDDPNLEGYPVAALAALPAGSGLLNEYGWGGFLIWYAPTTPVFIDGRLFLYVPDVLDEYRSVVGVHPDWQAVISRRNIRTLLLKPTDAGAVRARELGWHVVSSSDNYIVLARP
jgi:hypothetical protein